MHNFGDFLVGGSISGVYLIGKLDFYQSDGASYNSNVDGDWGPPQDYYMKIQSRGITLEPSVGFKAGDKAVIFLGFRYQYLKTKVESNKKGDPAYAVESDYNTGTYTYEVDEEDIFYGVSLSISLLL